MFGNKKKWEKIVPTSTLKPGKPETCNNFFQSSNSNDRFTHLRLNLYPDGGVARLRVYGTPVFDWTKITSEVAHDIQVVVLTSFIAGLTC